MIAPPRDPEMMLRRLWEDGASGPLAAALALLSGAYRLGLATRERVYAWGVLKTERLQCPVVSIGNITLGGSGKTPTVELAARSLLALGARPAVVSRGYGRRSRGVAVIADRHGVKLDARAAGDEPLLLAERLSPVPVVVGENRFEAGRVAVERCGATVVLLDDGFQNRSVAKDLEIVVVNGRSPWGNGRLFPRGMLREPLSALARADLVVVTNPEGAAKLEAVSLVVRRHNGHAPVISGAYEVTDPLEARSGRRETLATLMGRKVLAFCGLGSPRSFADTLTANGFRVMGLVEFPDHHWFEPVDLAGLASQARASGADALVTTEKDWMRLRGLALPPIPVWVLPVKLVLVPGQEAWVQALGRVLDSSGARRA